MRNTEALEKALVRLEGLTGLGVYLQAISEALQDEDQQQAEELATQALNVFSYYLKGLHKILHGEQLEVEEVNQIAIFDWDRFLSTLAVAYEGITQTTEEALEYCEAEEYGSTFKVLYDGLELITEDFWALYHLAVRG